MLAEALSRTMLLMRTDLAEAVHEAELLSALTSTTVAMAADAATLATHSGQCAYIAAALQIARSGHQLWLAGPNVPILGAQPPLLGGRLMDVLSEIGRDLLPGYSFRFGAPQTTVDLVVLLGAAGTSAQSEQRIALNATDWGVILSPGDNPKRWEAGDWPIGACAAAALAAGEAFKCAMRRLRHHARAPLAFDRLYAPAKPAAFELAPPDTPKLAVLPPADMISGGAIANAAVFVLLRLPGVRGHLRVFDHDESALSNLNRNMMLRRTRLNGPKVTDLATYGQGLVIEPVPVCYDDELAARTCLAHFVLIGVDDIPSRWRAQAAAPDWLGVGATSQFMAMASHHEPDLACAACLHPYAAADEEPIPTVAFVSFWGGLLLTTAFLRRVAAGSVGVGEQQVTMYPLRPERLHSAPVHGNVDCRVRCSSARGLLAATDTRA